MNVYGAQPEKALEVATRLSESVLPTGRLNVSGGDCVGYDGWWLCHRASTNAGMAGAAVRSMSQPQLILGTHIGASRT